MLHTVSLDICSMVAMDSLTASSSNGLMVANSSCSLATSSAVVNNYKKQDHIRQLNYNIQGHKIVYVINLADVFIISNISFFFFSVFKFSIMKSIDKFYINSSVMLPNFLPYQ